MHRHHPDNVRIIADYLQYLEHARGRAPSSIDHVAAAIAQFQESTNFKDFRRFHPNQAVSFKEKLHAELNQRTGMPLATSTIHSRLAALEDFFVWLADRPTYKSRIRYTDAHYFRLSANDDRVARAARSRSVPGLDQIRVAFDAMPTGSIVERRNRAIFAALPLFGARDDALASLLLKHVDVATRSVFQDARQVRTKNAKTFTSFFFPVDQCYAREIEQWVEELTRVGYRPDDPLFPATDVKQGLNRLFSASGIKPVRWRSANAIRGIVKDAFQSAGLPHFQPHSFRHAVARLCERICTTAETWQACSQNFGHSSPMTTFTSYGEVPEHRQGEIMRSLAPGAAGASAATPVRLDDEQVKQIMEGLARRVGAKLNKD
jgi:integrase